MCGIVGAVARRNVVPILLEGLKRLEYRGYDSAGIAVVNGSLQRVRSLGRVSQLDRLVAERSLHGTIGIAHTRWATHGAPSETNAHPHVSGGISVVHNGIIENHDAMRASLRALGYAFLSETDTEVIAHLVHSFTRGGMPLFEAVRASIARARGGLRDRGARRARPAPHGGRAHGRAAAARHGRRGVLRRLRHLGADARHPAHDLPRGGRLRRGGAGRRAHPRAARRAHRAAHAPLDPHRRRGRARAAAATTCRRRSSSSRGRSPTRSRSPRARAPSPRASSAPKRRTSSRAPSRC